jgi:hypothetical protein
MTLAGGDLAEAREGVEILEQGLGDGGEVGAPTDTVQVGDQLATGPIQMSGALEPAGLQVLEMPQELFAVELREGSLLLRVQIASEGFDTSKI